MKSKQGGIPPTIHQIKTAEEQSRYESANASNSEGEQSTYMLLKLSQVLKRTSLGKTSIYKLVKQGAFPRPLKVGNASLWIDQEISNWIVELMTNRSEFDH